MNKEGVYTYKLTRKRKLRNAQQMLFKPEERALAYISGYYNRSMRVWGIRGWISIFRPDYLILTTLRLIIWSRKTRSFEFVYYAQQNIPVCSIQTFSINTQRIEGFFCYFFVNDTV